MYVKGSHLSHMMCMFPCRLPSPTAESAATRTAWRPPGTLQTHHFPDSIVSTFKIPGTFCRKAMSPSSLYAASYAACFATPACVDHGRPRSCCLSTLSCACIPCCDLCKQAAFACCRSIAAYTAQPSILQKPRLTADASWSRLTKPCSCPADHQSTHLIEKCPMLVGA